MIVDGPCPNPPESSPGARAFGATIRGRRIAAGITLRRMAELTGVSMAQLSRWEQGAEDMPQHHFAAFNAACVFKANKETKA